MPSGEFVLKDTKGVTQALLTMSGEDRCEFSLLDSKQRKRIIMAVGRDGMPQMYFTDETRGNA